MGSQADDVPFRIGLVGDSELPGARRVLLRASISRVLREVAEGVGPLLHLRAQPGSEISRPLIVSSLSNRAERIMAEEGLAAGYELCALLGATKAETLAAIAEDVDRQSLERLLDRASDVREPTGFLVEPDGMGHHMLGLDPAANPRLLGNIDLLAVVWDGTPSSESGSVGANATAAAEQGVPVVWIDRAPPHDIRLYSQSEPHAEAWNRILPPGVVERLESMSTPRGAAGHTPSA